VDGAVGAFGEGFADGFAGALGAGAQDDDFTAMGFLELKGFFEGVGVGLVHGELDVLEVDPFARGVDAYAGIAFGDLLDCYNDFHCFLWFE
jgi:hypothetical protein